MFFRYLFFACIAFCCFSCGPDYLYKEEKPVAGGQWTYGDTLDFRFSIIDTAQLYNLYADFEYLDTFPTQNIYLKLYTRFPDGKRVSRVRSMDLFDTEGNSTGDCSGHACKTRILLQDKAYFNMTGEYAITLEQFTRIEPLPAINLVGLTVEKTGVPRGKK